MFIRLASKALEESCMGKEGDCDAQLYAVRYQCYFVVASTFHARNSPRPDPDSKP